MVLIFINKDVFESGYNDLKFMVWNCNYCFGSLYSFETMNIVVEGKTNFLLLRHVEM